MSVRPPDGKNTKLVTAREALGLFSQVGLANAFEEHARSMGLNLTVSVRQVRRWESTDPPLPNPEYRRVLEDFFGRPLDRLGFTTLSYAESTDQGWRSLLRDAVGRTRQLIRLEADAFSVRNFQPILVPGLLHSPDYALATLLMCDPTLSLSAAQERQRVRMERADRLMHSGRPAWFIITEPTLYQPIGDTRVLADQLVHLIDTVTRYPHITVQVLPNLTTFTSPAPCLILEPKPGHHVVWLEHMASSALVEDPVEVRPFLEGFDRLHTAALSPAASLTLMDTWQQQLRTSIRVSDRLAESGPQTAEAAIMAGLRSSALSSPHGTP